MTQFPRYPGFVQKQLSSADLQSLEYYRKLCSSHILLATTLAGCGHPGGSLSSLPSLLALYAGLRFWPQQPLQCERDRVFISHGHISPGTYAVLAAVGYFPAEEMILQFRDAGSRYAGHVEIDVPGVEWNTGNLGQGLSAGTASALAAKIHRLDYRTFVLMGDGEQQKGQLSEARRFAVKYGLDNLIAIIDYNRLQIGGPIEKIMPQNIAGEYQAAGWNVIEVDGHDLQQLYHTLAQVYHGEVEMQQRPTLLLARTCMGHGVSFIENQHEYHGKALSLDQLKLALQELHQDEDLDHWQQLRHQSQQQPKSALAHVPLPLPALTPGTPRLYPAGHKLDNRSAYGNALADLARANNRDKTVVVGITCDLQGSVKMNEFAQVSPHGFIESGIQEHHASALAGRLSLENFVVFFSTFGIFGTGEAYNQMRLNTLNRTNLKLVCTHIGLNVGEDGPTHQSIDYIGLTSNLFGIRVAIPADPNQTDRIIRKVATLPGNDFVGMGRDKAPIILTESGQPFFDEQYQYVPGKADWIRRGQHGTLIAIGPMLPVCLQAHIDLAQEGIQVGVVNMASVVPLDREAIEAAAATGVVVTVEDHNVNTGLGSLVAGVLAENGAEVGFARIGVSHYSSSGIPAKLYAEQGLTAANVAATIKRLIAALQQKG